MKKLKIAIITYNTNNKDVIRPVGHYNPEWDYFCFTDNPEFHHLVYQPILLEKIDDWEKQYRRIMKTRWLTHKAKELKKHDIHVVHDGNIQIISNLQPLIDKAIGGFYILDHWLGCVYEAFEMKRKMISEGKQYLDTIENLNKHETLYKKRKFPKKYGYWSCNTQIRDMREEKVISCLEEWEKEYDQGSYRDQLSLPMAVLKSGIGEKLIVGDGHALNSEEFKRHFKYHFHLSNNH